MCSNECLRSRVAKKFWTCWLLNLFFQSPQKQQEDVPVYVFMSLRVLSCFKHQKLSPLPDKTEQASPLEFNQQVKWMASGVSRISRISAGESFCPLTLNTQPLPHFTSMFRSLSLNLAILFYLVLLGGTLWVSVLSIVGCPKDHHFGDVYVFCICHNAKDLHNLKSRVSRNANKFPVKREQLPVDGSRCHPTLWCSVACTGSMMLGLEVQRHESASSETKKFKIQKFKTASALKPCFGLAKPPWTK